MFGRHSVACLIRIWPQAGSEKSFWHLFRFQYGGPSGEEKSASECHISCNSRTSKGFKCWIFIYKRISATVSQQGRIWICERLGQVAIRELRALLHELSHVSSLRILWRDRPPVAQQMVCIWEQSKRYFILRSFGNQHLLVAEGITKD
jgi:hypothetical protein